MLGLGAQPVLAKTGIAERFDGDDCQKHQRAEHGHRGKQAMAGTPPHGGTWTRQFLARSRRHGAEIGNLIAPEPDFLVPGHFLIHAMSRSRFGRGRIQVRHY
ncbi:hypothetical protein GCM10010836_15310 [Aminobacter aminovorans]